MLLKAIARFDSKKLWTRVDRPISRQRRVNTTEEKWHKSDKKWNGSNHVCKETLNFYPFRYGTIGATDVEANVEGP